ncbi:MAG: Alpha/beta hydrolase domain, partial [Trebonia sp.]|nr:Alpha/beta hydrolase domain [Trebonia sp.]
DLPDGSDLAVVPGASHLFAEPGALDQVATLAAAWFTRHVRDGG